MNNCHPLARHDGVNQWETRADGPNPVPPEILQHMAFVFYSPVDDLKIAGACRDYERSDGFVVLYDALVNTSYTDSDGDPMDRFTLHESLSFVDTPLVLRPASLVQEPAHGG